MGKKLNIEFIRAEFKKEGYILLTKVYDNAQQKLDYICPEGHRHSVSWGNWNSKNKCRCPYCNGNGKLTIEHIRAEFAKEGYILLTKIYKNAHQRLNYICPRGCRHSINWNNWQQNKRCPCFSNLMRPTIEFIRSEFAKEGYILLTKVYKGNKQKLKYICPRGHKHSVSWNNWNKGARCPYFSNKVSKWEKTVKSFLSELNIDHIPNDRAQLTNPKTGHSLELDIWFPKLNKAIECNGLYWHSLEKAIKRDKIKRQLCKDQNIDLLVVTEKEWDEDINQCKNKIQKFLC
jgi:hypothetical protein